MPLTNRAISEGIKFHLSFQSRVGPVQWLRPYTEDVLEELGKEGVKNLVVVPVSIIFQFNHVFMYNLQYLLYYIILYYIIFCVYFINIYLACKFAFYVWCLMIYYDRCHLCRNMSKHSKKSIRNTAN